jgi:phage tail protein X
MLDLRLPYFYNLPIAVLLFMYVGSRLEAVLGAVYVGHGGLDAEGLLYIKALLITLPAMTAAAYFIKQFYERNDVYVRETLFILGVVNFLGYLIPAFLR